MECSRKHPTPLVREIISWAWPRKEECLGRAKFVMGLGVGPRERVCVLMDVVIANGFEITHPYIIP